MAAPVSLVPAATIRATPTLARRQLSSRPASAPTPSTEEILAINSLLPFDESRIIAWLTLVRSIEPGLKCRPGAGHLTAQQLDALSLLSPLPDRNVKVWLGLGRRDSGSVNSDRFSQCSTLAGSRISRASSTAADTFASLTLKSTPENPIGFSDLDDHTFSPPSTTSTRRLEVGDHDLDKKIPPPLPPKDVYAHFATSRENDRPMMTCDGFKRHEKEQARCWVFMPFGAIQTLPQGTRCSLCPTPDPDVEHLRFHGTQDYASRRKPITKSRRGEFEKVLRAHKASDEWIQELVEKWRVDQPRKAYSCGFCIKLFRSLSERNNHLCHEHFHRGQDMAGWHITNLIRGLLLQEDVNRAYRNAFGMDPCNMDSHRTWHSPSLKDLQYRLELGEESPDDLALAAYNATRHLATFHRDHEVLNGSTRSIPEPQGLERSSVLLRRNMTPSHNQLIESDIGHPNLANLGTAQPNLVSGVNAPVRTDSLGSSAQANAAARFDW